MITLRRLKRREPGTNAFAESKRASRGRKWIVWRLLFPLFRVLRRQHVTKFAMANAATGRRDVAAGGERRGAENGGCEGESQSSARRETLCRHRTSGEKRHRIKRVDQLLAA